MIKALLYVRLKALLAGLLNQGRQKKKKSKGMMVLFTVLYIYVAVVMCGMMCMLFSQLAQPYHQQGLDWLYFAMAGLMALGFAVIGSVFTTQSQLYDAKDNDLLLSMPIQPRTILLSRMIPLLGLNLLFGGLVLLSAAVMYWILVGFSVGSVFSVLFSLAVVCLLAQAIACLLGWLLHLLLSKVNKSLASMLYMVVFLGLYFVIYGNASDILNSIATEGEQIAAGLRMWAWPLYAMGQGCMGELLYLLIYGAIGAVAFAAVYWLLSITFLRTATMKRGGRKKKLDTSSLKAESVSKAIVNKELRRFLGSPVYLTNMGLGIVFVAALAIVGVIFKDTLLAQLEPILPVLRPYFPLIICGLLAYVGSMMCVSTPSVSLEGKNIWILKSMPVSAKQILLAKLRFHMTLTTPVAVVAGIVLALVYECDPISALLCGVIPGLLTVLNGLLGMVCGLRWARLDWLSEAYPCKQSVSVAIVMFGMMGVPLLFGGLFFLVPDMLPSVFLGLTALVLCAACAGLYRVLVTWGTQKWNSL